MSTFEQKLVFIISSMRAGSTLLKALIATRPDTSDIPEVAFRDIPKIKSNKKILVIKKPGWYTDDYPPILPERAKAIALIRHPYETISSLKIMNEKLGYSQFNSDRFLISYWIKIYQKLAIRLTEEKSSFISLRYEDLCKDPILQTQQIFKFIGTSELTGTDKYYKPTRYNWKWGKDDGGQVINELHVCNRAQKREDLTLLISLENNDEVKTLLDFFGYS